MGFQERWYLLALVAAVVASLSQTATAATPTASPNKTVVVDVRGWIRVYSDGTVDRLTPQGAEPFTADVPPYAVPRGGVTVHDVRTSHGVDVRIYLPESAAHSHDRGRHRRPVLVHFHGGGFCVSRPSWALYHNFYAPLTATLRVAGIVSVYLPLAPEHRLPAAVDAGRDALLWLRDVARGSKNTTCGSTEHAAAAVERLRAAADFSRVFLIGDSSGGNLVHLVARTVATDPLRPVRLAGGVLLHPGFARERRSRSELTNPPGVFLTQEMIDKLLKLALPLGAIKDSPYTSPELAAADVAHVRMPPMLVAAAEKDLLRDPQLDYAKAMARHGKTVETLLSRGNVEHVFFLNFVGVKSNNLTAARTRELVQAIASFIDRH